MKIAFRLKLLRFFVPSLVLAVVAAHICVAETPDEIKNRMLGGKLTDIWEGPFAFISIDDNTTACSGILVGPSEVLTAAHCVAGDSENPRGYQPYEYEVAVGGQFFTVAANYYSSGYRASAGVSQSNAEHDLGMLILNGTVTGSAPLPILSGLEPAVGEVATIFGFGVNRSPATSAFEIFYNAGEQGKHGHNQSK